VVPTFVLIGPLAILAALFPTVFGGLAVMMKRWTAALSISSLVSTVYFLQMWFYGRLAGTWLATPTGLWTTLAAISVIGAVWAGVRYRKAIRDADFETYQPRRWDYLALVVLSAACLAGIAYLIATKKNVLQAPYLDLLASCVPVWVATAALVFVRSGPEGTSAFSLESAFLWGLVFACANVVALEHGRAGGTGVQVVADTSTRMPRPAGTAWVFEPAGDGTAYATPVIAGNRMYLAAVHGAGFTQFGTVYCIDANTGKEVWRFDDGQQMKAAFCSPALSDGRVYIGEGFHEDHDCKMYCLDAVTGKKVWEFKTTSHTESAPVVADGKVYFGAGDDGVFCLNAVDGTRVWNYPGVHVDANPVVEKGRLYVGSGVGDKFRDTVLLCLDTEKGTELWKVPVDEAAFAPPLLAGNHVYFGIGNGNFGLSAEKPVGALLCVETATGKRLWRCDVPDTVLCKPAVDSDYVYFTARDGNCYCASGIDGRVKWKQPIGGPAVAAPALVSGDEEFGTVRSLYVATTDGRIACLNPDDGKPFWSRDLTRLAKLPKANISATPVVVSRTEGGVERRRIVIAAGVSNETTSLARVYCFEDEVK
jgi:outer membrane protein assembly factor BamB